MTQLDLAFCCDCTGSMGAYIRSAQENIYKIAKSISEKSKSVDIHYALVKYRDHPPQDTSYVTQVSPFQGSLDIMKKAVDTMSANGGGDGPEAVAAAMHDVCHELQWRPNATKVCVFIADAPPHGLGESGDGFPNGCPLGYDPIVTAKAMAEKSITVYAVGVEPVLSTQYRFARDFMMSVAEITSGKFIPLGKAEILADIVVSGALEGMNMDAMWEKMEAEVEAEAKLRGDTERLSNEHMAKEVHARIARRGAPIAQVEVDNPYMSGYDSSNVCAFTKQSDLRSARAHLNPEVNRHVAEVSANTRWCEQQACVEESAYTGDQISRAVQRGVFKRK